MRNLFTALITTAVLSACSNHPYATRTPHGEVSLVSLLVHPSAFAEQQIEVLGYFQHDAGYMLYLDKDHGDVVDHTSGVHVTPFDSEIIYKHCTDQYVRITATVKFTPPLVTLTDVVNIQDAKTVADCWNKQIEEESGSDYSTQ